MPQPRVSPAEWAAERKVRKVPLALLDAILFYPPTVLSLLVGFYQIPSCSCYRFDKQSSYHVL